MAYKKIIGIYKIKNLINGKIYIGQSKNIKARLWQHKRALNKNEHINKHLQSSWNKYGENNFKFEILYVCDIEELDEKEIYYIQYYKSFNRKYGYNIELGGNENKFLADETKEKMSISNKKRKLQVGEKNNFAVYNNKQIAIVKELLYLGMDFDEIVDISKVNRKTVLKVRSLESWKDILPELNETIVKIPINIHGSNHKPVIMFDKQMNILEKFHSAKEAGLKFQFSHSTICGCCNGDYLLGYDYVWLYDDIHLEENIVKKKQKLTENKVYIIHRINENNILVETFKNATEVAKKYNLDASSILKVCNGKISNTKGYRFTKEYV